MPVFGEFPSGFAFLSMKVPSVEPLDLEHSFHTTLAMFLDRAAQDFMSLFSGLVDMVPHFCELCWMLDHRERLRAVPWPPSVSDLEASGGNVSCLNMSARFMDYMAVSMLGEGLALVSLAVITASMDPDSLRIVVPFHSRKREKLGLYSILDPSVSYPTC